MRDRLTATTFLGGPKDELAAPDVYEKEDSLNVNISTGEDTDAATSEDMKSVQGGNSMDPKAAEDLALDMCKSDAGLELNADSLLKGIVSSNSDLLSGLNSLPAELQSQLLKVNTALSPVQSIVSGVSNIVATVGDISKTIINADLKTLNGLGTMLNTLACDKTLPISFSDVTGLSNLITNLIREASNLSIPNAFSGIVNCIQNNTMLGDITQNLIPDVISNSDTSLLVQMATGKTAVDIIKYSPSFAVDYTSNYVAPVFTTSAGIVNEYNDITTSLSIIDPTWGTCRSTDTDNSINGTASTTASEDFRKLEISAATSSYNNIDTSNPAEINSAINTSDASYRSLVSGYENTSVSSEINNNFPLVNIEEKVTWNQGLVDFHNDWNNWSNEASY